jgi:hypothetical protein
MKLTYKICLANIAIAFLIAFIVMLSFEGTSPKDYFIFLGVVSIVGGIIDLLVGIILIAFGKEAWGQGYMLTAGILLLIGFASCSPYWAG